MRKKDFDKHPTVVHASKVAKICEPLEQALGIDYFCHVIVEDNKDFIALGKHPKFAKHYIDRQYYNADIHLSDNKLHEEYVVQDLVQHQASTESLFKDCYDFNIHHIFTLLIRNRRSVETFHFGSSKMNSSINEVYLSNLDYLKKFVTYFKSTAIQDKDLAPAYDFKLAIDSQNAQYLTKHTKQMTPAQKEKFLQSLNTDKIYLPFEPKVCLTQREFASLQQLSSAKTFEEAAINLCVSRRTVKARIESCKEKLGCYSLFQLGEKLASLKDLI